MRKRFAILSLVFLITVVLTPTAAKADTTPPALATVTGTSLTDGATYSIGTEADFAKLAWLVNFGGESGLGEDCSGNYFVLTNNIALMEDHNGTVGGGSEGKWVTIGGGTFNEATLPSVFGSAFNGTFYGQNHTISGMDMQKIASAGLFGLIGPGGTVLDLTVEGTFTGADWAGGIAGINCGSIINCTNKAAYTNGTATAYSCIGGIAGVNMGTIQNCVNVGSITGYKSGSGGDFRIGGIAGYCFESTQVLNCVNTAPIQGFSETGGIVGDSAANNANKSIIRNCYNTGDITAYFHCGGIAGQLNHNSILGNCYTTGSIHNDRTEWVGAVIGSIQQESTAEHYYWLSSTYSDACGYIHPVATVTNFASFTSNYRLSSDASVLLYEVLDEYAGDHESFNLRRWTNDPSSDAPFLTGTVILSNPADCWVPGGDTANFTVLAIGSPIEYHWRVSTDDGWSWTDVSTGSGSNTPRYTTAAVTADMNGNRYHCAFSAGASAEASYGAKLTTGGVEPEITTQPEDQYLIPGEVGHISIAATGEPDPSYEWYASLDGGAWVSAVVTGPYIDTFPMDAFLDGRYSLRCEVSNPLGSVTSNAVTLYLATVPAITTQPTDKTAAAGKAATFSVTATGTPLPTYQWQIDRGSGWHDISGATDASYTTGGVALPNDGYQYRVVVKNKAGSVTSDPATLHVVEKAIIPPTGDTARPGLWLGTGLLAAACIAAAVLILRKRRGKRT